MTDLDELIAEARKAERAVYLATEESVAKDISRIIKGLADALEAATRVPVQGEPNDELIAALRERAQTDSPVHELMKEAADALESVRAERDAAVAAIERVQETLSLHNPNGRLVKEVLAALDGAPEPEEAELPETGLEVRDGDGDLIMSGEHRKVLHQGMYVCDSCVNDLGLNVRWDRAGFMEGHPLPVEGESK